MEALGVFASPASGAQEVQYGYLSCSFDILGRYQINEKVIRFILGMSAITRSTGTFPPSRRRLMVSLSEQSHDIHI